MFTFTISLVSDVTQSDDTLKMALLWSKVWTITAGRPLTTGLSHPPRAVTSLNGIWPAECLGSVWGWCQSKSKQVLQSAALTTSLNSKTFLQGTTHLSQWESREMIRLELACKRERVLGLCCQKIHGGGARPRWENECHYHHNILLKHEGVHPAAVEHGCTAQHILHIYTHQVFPNRLVFV